MTSLTLTAASLITNAQHKSATATHTIATLPVAPDEIGTKEYNSNNLINPVLSLKEAEIETSAAVKLFEAEEKTQGSLFNASA